MIFKKKKTKKKNFDCMLALNISAVTYSLLFFFLFSEEIMLDILHEFSV